VAALALLFLDRHQKKTAPQRAAKPTTPTTTPAAIAAVFLLLEAFSFSFDSVVGVAELSDVTMTVCPLAAVETAVAAPVCVVVDEPVVVVELDCEDSEYVGTSSS
jgi:hypothetical protein